MVYSLYQFNWEQENSLVRRKRERERENITPPIKTYIHCNHIIFIIHPIIVYLLCLRKGVVVELGLRLVVRGRGGSIMH